MFFVLCAWGFDDAPGRMLTWAFENFLIELGLYKNPFDLDCGRWEILATKGTWLKNLWQLARHLNVTIELDPKVLIRPIRQNDRSIMGEFHRIGFEGTDLVVLKVVANFKCVLHLSDIV